VVVAVAAVAAAVVVAVAAVAVAAGAVRRGVFAASAEPRQPPDCAIYSKIRWPGSTIDPANSCPLALLAVPIAHAGNEQVPYHQIEEILARGDGYHGRKPRHAPVFLLGKPF
jgi:hypothetical protein